ncbi:nitrate/nitrite transporter [Actinomycetospora sp. TBRC 11914]|uniref:MFS transporter n=1 Tax=Actinomycetospora sp. TBRC 11914 TaxID=2729387 RepID=UPI00145E1B57|nr:MFS transporter [Actinomycetospora sp. TBRC 11914]NMO92822.1 MFS transporter [Actinomycetospora sp. TBRC 11914]
MVRLLVWGTAVVAYVLAVVGRSALAATGVTAAQRFDVSAATLSLLAVLSLAVYAALQIPAGVLVDRFGARRLIAGGAVLVAVGQAVLALAPTFPLAVCGRVLAGAGDAVTFVSILRLVPTWFAPRRVPLVNQLSGILGQLGQAVSAIPLAALVVSDGWTAAYLSAAGVTGLVAATAALVLRDGPRAVPPAPDEGSAGLGDVVRSPGARLGFWCHLASPFGGNVFGLLWGFPFLAAAEHVPGGVARVLTSGVVVVNVVIGPVFGLLSGRFPHRRVALIAGSVTAQVVAWVVVLSWPGDVPWAVLVALVVVLGSGGSASLVAFDVARSAVAPSQVGRASGVVNVGGFTSSLLVVALVGILLDAQGAGAPADWTTTAFRVAMAVHVPVALVGLAGMWFAARRVRAAGGSAVGAELLAARSS